jgi:hypothetical protein
MADNKIPTIAEEAGLPENWVPIDVAPIVPSRPPQLNPDSSSSSSAPPVGSLPPSYQQNADFVRNAYRGQSTPNLSLMPLGIQGNPATNAAIQSTSTTIATSVVAASGGSGGGGITSVGLTVPSELSVANSPLVPPGGTLILTWTPEPAGTVFSGSLPNLTGFQGTASGSASTPPPPTTVTMTPQTATSFGLVLINNGIAGPSGWTQVAVSQSNLWYKVISGTTPVSATSTGGFNHFIDMALFTGPAPGLVQSGGGGAPNNTTVTLPFTSANISGNTLVIAVSVNLGSGTDPVSIVVSDSKQNLYQQIVNHSEVIGIGGGLFGRFSNAIFVMTGCASGSNTVSVTVNGGTSSVNGSFVIAEFGPLAPGAGIPSFKVFSGAEIPPINLAIEGNGGVGGILPVSHGGTGVSTSTGTGSVVLSVSPTLTGTATLANEALTGIITKYNNINTVSNGVPSEYATVDLTGQTAAIATTTLYTISAIGAGQYRLSWNAKVTTAAGVSSTLGPLTITYTDPDGVVQTITAAAQSSAGVIETSDTGNSTTTVLLSHPLILNCRASTNIQYAFAYASNAANAMAYNLHLKLEAL